MEPIFDDPDGDAADELASTEDRSVRDDDHANRLLYSLRKRREQIARAKEVADAERERIDRWLAEQTNRLEAACSFIENSLTAYHRHVLDRDPKAKTLSFPNGTLTSRTTKQDKIKWDEDKAVAWARQDAARACWVLETRTLSFNKEAAPPHFAVTADGTVVDKETGEPVPDGVAAGTPAGTTTFGVRVA